MAISQQLFGQATLHLWRKRVDWTNDTVVATLHSSSMTPNADTWDFQNDLTNELSTANGYTAGGLSVPGKSVTYTAAASWALSRANSTAYALGTIVRPASANGHLYRCAVAGTTGGSIPTFPTVSGLTVTDGTVTWAEVGTGIVVINHTTLTWTVPSGQTLNTARYLVYTDTSPGSSSTNPIIGYVDLGSPEPSAGNTGVLSFTPDTNVGLFSTLVS